jgi:hypothetical protein
MGAIYSIIGALLLAVVLYLMFGMGPTSSAIPTASATPSNTPSTTPTNSSNFAVKNATFYEQNYELLLVGLATAIAFIISGIISLVIMKNDQGVFYGTIVLSVLIIIIVMVGYFYAEATFGKTQQATEQTTYVANITQTLCPNLTTPLPPPA